MKPGTSQRKGADAERELAAVLSAMFHVECRRGARPYLFGSMGPDVYGLPGIHIESKRREAFSLPAALRQSANDAGNGEVPIVCHRPNGCAWIVSVWLEDLVRLAAAVEELRHPPYAGVGSPGRVASLGFKSLSVGNANI